MTHDEDFDEERFLTEVDAQFQSQDIMKEVRWRVGVLKEISSKPGMEDVSTGLRDKLTQIFSKGGKEEEILENLKGLTEIKGADGESVELRRFLKRGKRTFGEAEYRGVLTRKLENTELQMTNLMAFFPDSAKQLNELSKTTKALIKTIQNPRINTTTIKDKEDEIRATPAFQAYEELKAKFLRDWLAQFSNLSAEEVEGMTPDQIQQMVVEHQRHQMTHLLKTKISVSETDMTDHLGLHDTLECTFSNKSFWEASNIGMRNGFRQWILTVIQSFGMMKGQRYAFFQSDEDKTQFMLFGLGIKDVPDDPDAPIQMIPYAKPFTRKGGYLLEIRNRDLSDVDQYNYELRHYVLPFLFAFDQIPNFSVSKDCITFFTSQY